MQKQQKHYLRNLVKDIESHIELIFECLDDDEEDDSATKKVTTDNPHVKNAKDGTSCSEEKGNSTGPTPGNDPPLTADSKGSVSSSSSKEIIPNDEQECGTATDCGDGHGEIPSPRKMKKLLPVDVHQPARVDSENADAIDTGVSADNHEPCRGVFALHAKQPIIAEPSPTLDGK